MNRLRQVFLRLKPLWPYVLAWVIALAGLMIGLYTFRDQIELYLFGERWIPQPVTVITNYFERSGIIGSLLYSIFFGVANSLFVPGFFLAAAAGLLFGTYLGIVVVMVGLVLSAQTMYWIGRYGGQSVLDWFSDETLEIVTSYLPRKTGTVVMLCRLVFFMPFHAFNAVCGAVKVPWVPYTIGTFVGLFPRMLVYLYIGVSLHPGGNISRAALYLVLLVVTESIYGAFLLQYYLKQQRNRDI